MYNLICRGHSTHGGDCAGAAHYLGSSKHGGVPTKLSTFFRRSVALKKKAPEPLKAFPQTFLLGKFNKPDDTLHFVCNTSE